MINIIILINMNTLTLIYDKQSKEITVDRVASPSDLAYLLRLIFKIKDTVIGITDKLGKFYDIDYAATNLHTLNGKVFNLITDNDIKQKDNISFGSKLDQQNQIKYEKQQPKCYGRIINLNQFQKTLKHTDYTVVVFTKQLCQAAKMPVPFYFYQSFENAIVIYRKQKIHAKFKIDNWKIISDLVTKFISSIKTSIQNQNQQLESNQKQLQTKDKPVDKNIVDYFLKQFQQLFQQNLINQLQFYKYKVKLYQNPQFYETKYVQYQQDQINWQQTYEILKEDIIKRRNELKCYEMMINGSNPVSLNSRDDIRSDIPIIVRKYNNVIEKVTTEYPLSIEQQQALNMLLEMQLKGLISEKQSSICKMYILDEDRHVFKIFLSFFQQEFDQFQLSNRLKDRLQWDNAKSPELLRKFS